MMRLWFNDLIQRGLKYDHSDNLLGCKNLFDGDCGCVLKVIYLILTFFLERIIGGLLTLVEFCVSVVGMESIDLLRKDDISFISKYYDLSIMKFFGKNSHICVHFKDSGFIAMDLRCIQNLQSIVFLIWYHFSRFKLSVLSVIWCLSFIAYGWHSLEKLSSSWLVSNVWNGRLSCYMILWSRKFIRILGLPSGIVTLGYSVSRLWAEKHDLNILLARFSIAFCVRNQFIGIVRILAFCYLVCVSRTLKEEDRIKGASNWKVEMDCFFMVLVLPRFKNHTGFWKYGFQELWLYTLWSRRGNQGKDLNGYVVLEGQGKCTLELYHSIRFSDITKYKGVVQHQNGRWGAQIYIDHKRIWLGTFSSAAEAAMAYDSASIKLRTLDLNSHGNFPWTEFTVQEQVFQKGYTTEVVLNMIKDGSYTREFRDFLTKRSQIVVGSKQSRRDEESNKCFSCTQLFQKELTASDVGKLNRLVIPKKYAVKYLPFISDDQSEREEGEIVQDLEVVFYDREMRQWNFRYCYWKSSQSFVFTRGWNGYVKEKSLKAKDVIIFYTCDVPTLDGQTKSFLMIDVHCFSDSDFVVTDEEVHKTARKCSEEVKKTENIFNNKLGEEDTKSEENRGGFMLFGVKIQ